MFRLPFLRQILLCIGIICLFCHKAEATLPSTDYTLFSVHWDVSPIPIYIDSVFIDTFGTNGSSCAIIAAVAWNLNYGQNIEFDLNPSGTPDEFITIRGSTNVSGGALGETCIVEAEYGINLIEVDVLINVGLASIIYTDIESDSPGPPALLKTHLYNIVLHELGHALGLWHAPDNETFKVMLDGGDWTQAELRTRQSLPGSSSLPVGDVAGIEFVYEYCYGDFDENYHVNNGDFDDYFDPAYGSTPSDSTWLPAADFDGSNEIDWPDFLYFAAVVGEYCSELVAYKPVYAQVQKNQDAELKWNWDTIDGTDLVRISFDINDVEQLQGYSLKLNYETTKLSLNDKYSAVPSKFPRNGESRPAIFKNWPQTGIISVADVFPDGQAVTTSGELLQLTFRTHGDFSPEDISIINASVSSGDWRDMQDIEIASPAPLRNSQVKLLLHQNTPNPFNPETVISYELPENGRAVLTIYNAIGQSVRTLVNEDISAGLHQVTWDGKDDRGATISSGIYLYELRLGTHRAIQKMVMLK